MTTRQGCERLAFYAAIGVATGLSWVALWRWGALPHGGHLHHADSAPGLPHAQAAVLLVAGWTVMMMAMMLPTAIPLLEAFRQLVRRRSDRYGLAGLVVAGFLGVWLMFGCLAAAGDGVLQAGVERVAWLDSRRELISAVIFITAGLYQLSGLKDRCLTRCRAPIEVLHRHWRGGLPAGQALRIGTDHGLSCVGCCWSLMLLMFAVGSSSVGWMLALGAVMAIEKNLPWGRHLTTPLGFLLFLLGIGMVAIAGQDGAQPGHHHPPTGP